MTPKEKVEQALSEEQQAYDAFRSKGEHRRTGMRCLLGHPEGGACIKCSCGEWVRPAKWEQHKADLILEQTR